MAYLIRPMVQGISPKTWPEIWYSTSILGSWNSHWLTECLIISFNQKGLIHLQMGITIHLYVSVVFISYNPFVWKNNQECRGTSSPGFWPTIRPMILGRSPVDPGNLSDQSFKVFPQCQCGPPSDVSWLHHINQSYKYHHSNHSYWSYKPT